MQKIGQLSLRGIPISGLVISGIAIAGAILGLVLFPRWNLAFFFAVVMSVLALSVASEGDMGTRLWVFFLLLGVVDYLKRMVLLFSDQYVWSQYLVLLVPHLYYALFIFLPWVSSHLSRRLTLIQIVVLVYILWALANTWLAPGFPLMSKMASTLLLIFPWTMIAVAADYGAAAPRVARVLVVCGLISVLFGGWQFIFGPTLVERRWAEAAAGISIGASHVDQALHATGIASSFYRPSGLQPDSFTFGMFLLTAFFCTRFLKATGKMSPARCEVAGIILVLGIILCLTRTIWVSLLAFVIFAWLFRHGHRLLRPGLILGMLGGLFFLSQVAAKYFYGFMGLAANIGSGFEARALTFGTLDARLGAPEFFLEVLPRHLLHGIGYASSSLVSGKFGENILLKEFTVHNVAVELLWYVGLPGLVMVAAIFYLGFARLAKSPDLRLPLAKQIAPLIAGFLIAMCLSGFGNGGCFLNYYFFFFLGSSFSYLAQHFPKVRKI